MNASGQKPRRRKRADREIGWGDLYLTLQKIKGIAYLIEHQAEDDGCPFDYEELQEGIGMTLRDLASEARELAGVFEERCASRKCRPDEAP